MKKIILILFIFIFSLQAYGFEDYIIVCENPVYDFYSKDENIVSVSPFFTIDNSKKTLIIKSKSLGKTTVFLNTDQGDVSFDVEVGENETILSDAEGVSFYVLDFLDELSKPVLRGKE